MQSKAPVVEGEKGCQAADETPAVTSIARKNGPCHGMSFPEGSVGPLPQTGLSPQARRAGLTQDVQMLAVCTEAVKRQNEEINGLF